MKENYLPLELFNQSIDEMVAELTGHHYRPKPWKLNPGKAALLVLDMQNYFLDPSSHAFTPSAPAIVSNINNLIGIARQFNMEIIFTRHVNDVSNAGRMNKWWKDLVKEDSFEAQIFRTVGLYEDRTVRLYEDKTEGLYEDKSGELDSPVRDDSMVDGRRPATTESPIRDDSMVEERTATTESPTRDDSMVRPYEDMIMVKHQYDAFYNTNLEEYLHSKNIEQLIITGVLTNLCCETTARSAFVRGFEVLFPLDATAAYNREFHVSTFRNMGFGFCPVLKTSDLINSLNEPV